MFNKYDTYAAAQRSTVVDESAGDVDRGMPREGAKFQRFTGVGKSGEKRHERTLGRRDLPSGCVNLFACAMR